MALRPLPSVSDPTPTGNVSLIGAAGIGQRAKAQAFDAIARSAGQVRQAMQPALDDAATQQANTALADAYDNRVEGDLAIPNIELRTAWTQADRVYNDAVERGVVARAGLDIQSEIIRLGNDTAYDPGAFDTGINAFIDQYVSSAPSSVAQQIDLTMRNSANNELARISTRTRNQEVRSTDQAIGENIENLRAQLDTQVRDGGAGIVETEGFAITLAQVDAEIDGRVNPALGYTEEWARNEKLSIRNEIAVGVIRGQTMQVLGEEGFLAAREFAEESLSSLTMGQSEFLAARSSILTEARGLQADQRRSREQGYREMAAEIGFVESNAANEGVYPDADFSRRMGAFPEGPAVLESMIQDADLFNFGQSIMQANDHEAQEIISEAIVGVSSTSGMSDAERLAVARQYRQVAEAALYRRGQLYRDDPMGAARRLNPGLNDDFLLAQTGPVFTDVEDQTAQGLIAQESVGILRADRRILAVAEVGQWIDQLRIDPEDPDAGQTLINGFAAFREQYGRFANQGIQELEAGGLSSSAAVVVRATGTELEAIAAQSAGSSAGDLETVMRNRTGNRERIDDIRTDVSEAIAPLGQTIATEFGNSVPSETRMFDQIYLLALQMGVNDQERNVDDIATQAASLYTRNYTMVGTYRVPISVNPDSVNDTADRIRFNLDATNVEFPDSASGAEGENLAAIQNLYLQNVKTDGYWRTNGDETGLLLFDPVSRPVFSAETGEQIFFAWDDATPETAEERRARFEAGFISGIPGGLGTF